MLKKMATGALKRGTSEIVNIFVAVEEGTLWKIEWGTLWGFSTSILSQNIKKLKGGNLNFSEKNLTVPKN